MKDEGTYYQEQAVTLGSKEVVENKWMKGRRSKLKFHKSHIMKKKRALRLLQH
jgi:hypothetical protein